MQANMKWVCDSPINDRLTHRMNSADAIFLGGDGGKLSLAVEWQINQLIFTRFALQNFAIIAQWRKNFAGMQGFAAVIAPNDKSFPYQHTNVPSTRKL